MAQKNDDRIMELKKWIENKKKELAKQSNRFVPITNCILVLDKITYNLHVDSSVLLFIKLNAMIMSAKDADIDPSTVIISGYSLTDWAEDIKNYLEVQKYKENKRKLEKKEKELDMLLSNDKRTELEIDKIASELFE